MIIRHSEKHCVDKKGTGYSDTTAPDNILMIFDKLLEIKQGDTMFYFNIQSFSVNELFFLLGGSILYNVSLPKNAVMTLTQTEI